MIAFLTEFVHDAIEIRDVVVKGYHDKIFFFEVKFFDSFNRFQDSPYPALGTSGCTAGDVQLNDSFFSHRNISKNCHNNQNKNRR